jgi:hypothetical protein
VLHCRQSRPAIRNAELLGAVRLADGSEALVIARHSPSAAGSATYSVDDRDEALSLLKRPELGALVHGADADGCLWFINVFSRQRE